MSQRLTVLKTYKLFIGGAFPRSEPRRSRPAPTERRVVALSATPAAKTCVRLLRPHAAPQTVGPPPPPTTAGRSSTASPR